VIVSRNATPLFGEFVEGVAGAEVGEETGGGLPIAAEVGAAGDAVVVAGAEVFEIGDRQRVGGTTFAPAGGVNGVARFAATKEGVAPIFPVAVIGEADGEFKADAEGFGDDLGGLPDFFERAGYNDVIKIAVVERAHEGHHLALVGAESAFDAGGDFIEVEIHADALGVFGVSQGFQ